MDHRIDLEVSALNVSCYPFLRISGQSFRGEVGRRGFRDHVHGAVPDLHQSREPPKYIDQLTHGRGLQDRVGERIGVGIAHYVEILKPDRAQNATEVRGKVVSPCACRHLDGVAHGFLCPGIHIDPHYHLS
jgi:hypothetical protein